ncbi:phosphoglycerate mutase-like protein [Pisolithus albus]|nr:phosphoglycerate mutase-like protein [Pisolithus albus]
MTDSRARELYLVATDAGTPNQTPDPPDRCTKRTMPNLPWNTYNYCNAPHVNPDHYSMPDESDTRLTFVIVAMRHHKRTPDNLYPSERTVDSTTEWDCSSIIPQSYAGGTAQIFTQTSTPLLHPFADRIWAGTCDSGQLTREGLDDAIKHGQDFWGVYHEKLGFLDHVNEKDIYIRTSTEPRTHQVAGAMLYGMDPDTAGKQWSVHMQPDIIDSLVPNYACPAAGRLRADAQATSSWMDHLVQHEPLQRKLGEMLGTTGLDEWNTWYDHFFDTFTSRTCHGHPLPCNVTGACVTQEDAETVFSIGDWEYNYIFNDSPQASQYVKLTFGVFFAELANTLRHHKLHMYVGHDGSMVRLAAGLGLGSANRLRWPAMGSEIVMEVWHAPHDMLYVRVLHEGWPAPPPLDWIPLGEFIQLLEDLVPENLGTLCT